MIRLRRYEGRLYIALLKPYLTRCLPLTVALRHPIRAWGWIMHGRPHWLYPPQ